MVKLATFCTAVAACAVAVQGSVLIPKADCPTPDRPQVTCQTSGGSPYSNDCEIAINKLGGQCTQRNTAPGGSWCTTLVKVGSCKIDACGYPHTQLDEVVDSHPYMRTLLKACQSGGRVGGVIRPSLCYVDWRYADKDYPRNTNGYRLQFSH